MNLSKVGREEFRKLLLRILLTSSQDNSVQMKRAGERAQTNIIKGGIVPLMIYLFILISARYRTDTILARMCC